MRTLLLSIGFLCSLLLGMHKVLAQSTETILSNNIFHPFIRKAWENDDQTLSQPRTPLLFNSGREVSTCADYLEYRMESTPVEGVNNQKILQEYMICEAISLLRAAQRGRSKIIFSKPLYGQALFERLDLRTFASSLRAKAMNGPSFALATLNDNIEESFISAYAVELKTDDWSFHLEVIADVDLDGDGLSDWLVLLNDEARGGNYVKHALLLISAPDPKGLLYALERW